MIGFKDQLVMGSHRIRLWSYRHRYTVQPSDVSKTIAGIRVLCYRNVRQVGTEGLAHYAPVLHSPLILPYTSTISTAVIFMWDRSNAASEVIAFSGSWAHLLHPLGIWKSFSDIYLAVWALSSALFMTECCRDKTVANWISRYYGG